MSGWRAGDDELSKPVDRKLRSHPRPSGPLTKVSPVKRAPFEKRRMSTRDKMASAMELHRMSSDSLRSLGLLEESTEAELGVG